MNTSKEGQLFDRLTTAITEGTYQNTQWNKKIFYSDELEINGRMNTGAAPFVLFPNAMPASLENITNETDQGEIEFNILLVISRGLIDDLNDRKKLFTFDWEIQEALKTVEDDGLVKSFAIAQGITEVKGGFMTRELILTSQLAVCADRSEY